MRFRIIFLILKQDMAKFYFRTGKRIASSVAWVYGYDRDNAGFHSPTHHHHLPFPIYYLPVCIEMLVGDANSRPLFFPPRLPVYASPQDDTIGIPAYFQSALYPDTRPPISNISQNSSRPVHTSSASSPSRSVSNALCQ